jgi:hypothetical protein
MPETLVDLVAPLAAGTVVALAAAAFLVYVWTWVRYAARPDATTRDSGRPQRPHLGRFVTA